MLAAAPVAYLCGWSADLLLNDDPCLSAPVGERDRLEYERVWWPATVDCVVTPPGGRPRVVRDDSTVFYATFAFWLFVALMVVVPGREAVRAAAVGVAAVAALVVIFV